MNKPLFTSILILTTVFSFAVNAAPLAPVEKVLNMIPSGSILDTLIPSRKNCNYVEKKQYEPFSDIGEDFPGVGDMMEKGRDGKNDCVKITNGTENLLALLFTTAITIIIVLTVISISVAGIQYMTEQVTGQTKGAAKKRLQNSFIALGLGLLSYTILYTVNKQLVNFTFNPASIDIKGSIGSGINDANIAALTSGGSSALVSTVQTPYAAGNPISPTGYINMQTGAPCTPAAGVPDSLNPCVLQTATTPGATSGVFGNWNESTAENWVRGLSNGVRSTDGRLVVSVYSASKDSITDTNTAQKRGNANNLLREGSVALSPDLISRYRPKTGQEVLINGTSVGFYEDATASIYNGVTFNNTVDIYDENGTIGGSYLKNVPVGQWTISFGPARPQITNR